MIQPLRSFPITGYLRYYGSLRPCAVHWYSNSYGFIFPLEYLPYHHSDRFPRSTQKPESKSPHLYAGGRSVSNFQVSTELFLGVKRFPSFDLVLYVSTPHRWFICIGLFVPHLTGSSCLFLNVHYKGSLPMQLKVI